VDAEIRNRVKAAAARLGIGLDERRAESHRMLAFLLSNRDVLHTFQARVLVGAENFCSSRNWELVFLCFRYTAGLAPGELHLPQTLLRRSVARAAILAGVNHPNLLAALRERGIPFAVLGNNIAGGWRPEECDVVYSNEIQGACELTRHLLAQGHRHIWFVGNLELPWFARGARGYECAMREAGLEPRIGQIHSDGQELGYLATKSILGGGEPATAIFAGSDQVARGVYTALRESGIRVPGGMSVVGCNDTEAPLFEPALTSVREFPEELGRHLADFALRRIETPDLPPQQVTIPTQVVIRESVQTLRED
jgi:LacI family transcriptional regulator